MCVFDATLLHELIDGTYLLTGNWLYDGPSSGESYSFAGRFQKTFALRLGFD